MWTDAQDEVLGLDGFWHNSNKATIWRWREAFQNDFVARMDWTIKDYESTYHPPVAKLSSPAEISAKIGDKIELSAEASTDPDGNELSFKWYYYPEPGTFNIASARTGNPLKIENADKAKASFIFPKTGRCGTMHIILEVSDNGNPSLTRYQRVIVNVTE